MTRQAGVTGVAATARQAVPGSGPAARARACQVLSRRSAARPHRDASDRVRRRPRAFPACRPAVRPVAAFPPRQSRALARHRPLPRAGRCRALARRRGPFPPCLVSALRRRHRAVARSRRPRRRAAAPCLARARRAGKASKTGKMCLMDKTGRASRWRQARGRRRRGRGRRVRAVQRETRRLPARRVRGGRVPARRVRPLPASAVRGLGRVRVTTRSVRPRPAWALLPPVAGQANVTGTGAIAATGPRAPGARVRRVPPALALALAATTVPVRAARVRVGRAPVR